MLSINVVMMLTQNSLPSLTEATKSFVSDHGKEEFLCDWKCAKCNRHNPPGCCSPPVTERRNNYCDSYSLKYTRRNCSQLSTVGSSTISEGSTPPIFVYQRRKPQRNSSYAPNTKAGDENCLSTEAPSMLTKEHLDTQVVRSNIDDGGSGSLAGSVEDPKDDRQKDVDACCVNDSCSSSKSNMDHLRSASSVDDTGECSSSGALLTMGGMRGDLSEKDICISILKRKGVLDGVLRPIKGISTSRYNNSSCSRSCKACDLPEMTLKMLICDQCEEAFHVSCCNPRVKKISPGDEWFCNSCLKKKHKILKETAITTNGIGSRSRSATNGALCPIVLMLKDTRPYQSNVRVGKDFQAEVPEWSGSILEYVLSLPFYLY